MNAQQIAASVIVPILVALVFYALGVRHRYKLEARRDEILAALLEQQRALDHLLALRCADDPLFRPCHSLAWDGLVAGNQMIDRLKGEPK